MEEKTINIMDLVMIAWRRIWVIIIAAVVFAVATFGYCELFLTKKYSATASILVTNGAVTTAQDDKTDKVSGSDISASLYLTYTIVDILNTPDNYTKVAEELNKDKNNDYKYQDLMNRSTIVRRSEDTLFIDITFTSTNRDEAVHLANAFCATSCKFIPNIIPNANANVVAKADKSVQTYPRTLMSTAIAGVIGAVLAFIVLFIIDSTNRAIKGEEDFTNTFDVPLLGAVPDFENVESSGYRKSKGRGGYSNGY